ncbi:MAG: triose-phosphate isomerase [Chloroflexi bacterium]|nr:triose-phosphate isomerase [Chloroflexota bacterium]
MPTPFIAGNWKMNTTLDEAVALARGVAAELADFDGVEVAVCPPFVSLAAVRDALTGSAIAVGAQNMYHEDKGAFTGEVSPLMLKGLCAYVILGHSERRQYFHEQDADVNAKLHAAVNHALRPILCVGENLQQREQGATESVIAGQVRGALSGVPWTADLVIAYEPIWAIGTGRAATGQQAAEVAALIHREVAALYGASRSESVRILYGGSVTAANIGEFVSHKGIDGALVGGASLRAAEFAAIVRQTAAAKAQLAGRE